MQRSIRFKRVPALVLDDGTVITESIAICRYFEALQPDPPLFGRGALEIARIEMWNRRLELHLLFPVSHVFRHSHPAMKAMEVPQVPAWAEANKPRILEFITLLDRELEGPPFMAGDTFTVADITGLVAIDFMKPAKLAVPDELEQSQALACRSVGPPERSGLTMRLTIVGSGDAFGSGGRFNTCFHLETARAYCWSISAPPRWSRSRRTASIPIAIDGIMLSHLHGDHFGGLPFLLLDAQFLARRERPLLIAGPPGTRARLDATARSVLSALDRQQMAVFLERGGDRGRPPDRGAGTFGDARRRWCISPARRRRRCGFPTAKRFSPIPATPNGSRRCSRVADGADLFIVECYSYSGHAERPPDLGNSRAAAPDLRARRIMLTHMNPTMLDRLDEAQAEGVLIAEDGAVIEF